MTDKDARIAELEQDAKDRAEATQENYEIILKLREQIAELERKLAEQQAITQQVISLMEPIKHYLPASHIQRWISCIHSPSEHFNNLLAKAKEEGRKEVRNKFANSVNNAIAIAEPHLNQKEHQNEQISAVC